MTDVSLFGSAPATGRSFVFVVDRSNSMGGEGLGALALAEREFNRALTALEPTHKFQIVAYHHNRVFFGERELVAATDANKRRVSQFMRGLAAFGGTDHLMALTAALSFDPDVVFLLTDGGDPRLTKAHSRSCEDAQDQERPFTAFNLDLAHFKTTIRSWNGWLGKMTEVINMSMSANCDVASECHNARFG